MKTAAYAIMVIWLVTAAIMCYFKDGQEKPEEYKTYSFKRIAIGAVLFITLISLIYWL